LSLMILTSLHGPDSPLFSAQQMPSFCLAPGCKSQPEKCVARVPIGDEDGIFCLSCGSIEPERQLPLSNGLNRRVAKQSDNEQNNDIMLRRFVLYKFKAKGLFVTY
jgi:hypothetical protein